MGKKRVSVILAPILFFVGAAPPCFSQQKTDNDKIGYFKNASIYKRNYSLFKNITPFLIESIKYDVGGEGIFFGEDGFVNQSKFQWKIDSKESGVAITTTAANGKKHIVMNLGFCDDFIGYTTDGGSDSESIIGVKQSKEIQKSQGDTPVEWIIQYPKMGLAAISLFKNSNKFIYWVGFGDGPSGKTVIYTTGQINVNGLTYDNQYSPTYPQFPKSFAKLKAKYGKLNVKQVSIRDLPQIKGTYKFSGENNSRLTLTSEEGDVFIIDNISVRKALQVRGRLKNIDNRELNEASIGDFYIAIDELMDR